MTLFVRTTRFTRQRLPHWEIEQGRYFVTVRCQDSLPVEAVDRLREVNTSLQSIDPASTAFAQLQRSYFLALEKYLDAGRGESPLRHRFVAEILASEFTALTCNNVEVPHFTIMPNHWHALLSPIGDSTMDLHKVMTRLKGRTARVINKALNRVGPLWQREWFDRWIRDESEWDRCVEYIHKNPVKAGLSHDRCYHPWTR